MVAMRRLLPICVMSAAVLVPAAAATSGSAPAAAAPAPAVPAAPASGPATPETAAGGLDTALLERALDALDAAGATGVVVEARDGEQRWSSARGERDPFAPPPAREPASSAARGAALATPGRGSAPPTGL